MWMRIVLAPRRFVSPQCSDMACHVAAAEGAQPFAVKVDAEGGATTAVPLVAMFHPHVTMFAFELNVVGRSLVTWLS